ncbi:MAG: DUF2029 domain-containing protein [Oscillatoriales cyanobacterium C42_A2020_001]|nr:DUF2029 domain-containing protein [Leptolyngbyaceae cyanobacterium C42_A2020_001]
MIKTVYNVWKELSPATRLLCKIALVNLIVINLLLIIVLSTPVAETIISKLKTFFLVKGGSVTWEVLSSAYDYVSSHFQKPVYSEFFFDKKIKLQYPPTTLLLLSPFKIPIVANGLEIFSVSLYKVLNLVSWVLLIVTIYLVIRIFNLSKDRYLVGESNFVSKRDQIVSGIVIFCLSLSFYPLLRAYEAKQIHIWVTFFITLSFWLWLKRSHKFSGALMGLVCLVEPQYLAVFVWGVIRRHKVFSLTGIFTYGIGLILSILLFGWLNHINFLEVLAFVARHGEGFYPNQSVNGLLNRLLFNGNNLVWSDSFPPYHPVVYWSSIISSAILLGIAFFAFRKTSEMTSAADFLSIILASTMACPVVWELNYTVLLPVYAYLTPWLLHQKFSGRTLIAWLFLASYLLTSNYLIAANRLAGSPILNLAQSYLFFGALLAFFILQKARNLHTEPEPKSFDFVE